MDDLDEDLHPYVVFLPSDRKIKILSAIFGSRAAVDILRFSLRQGISNKIFQKDLVEKLSYSNKTIIENLKSMTRLRLLNEDMEKAMVRKRIVWVKTYRLTDAGKWFALLLAEERELTDHEKAEILQDLLRAYLRWVKNISQKLHVDRSALEKVFKEEVA